MISYIISFCAVVALSNGGVIHTATYPAHSPYNSFYPELSSPRLAYQSGPLTYPVSKSHSNLYPQLYQYAPTNYPYAVAAPLQYPGAVGEVALNEGGQVIYVEPIIHAPHQHIIPEAIVESQPELEEKPHYLFAYSVVDSNTGDNKHHQESREGDIVRGEYSLLEADGTVRRVEYTADPHKGFNAIVSRSKPKEHLEAEAATATKALAHVH